MLISSLFSLFLFTPTADAGGFDGKIKHIRIRERGNSRAFRIVATVSDDNLDRSDVALSLGMDFEPIGDAPELDPLFISSPTTVNTTFVVHDLQIAKGDADGTAPIDIALKSAAGEEQWVSVNLPVIDEGHTSREVTINDTDKIVVDYRVDANGEGRVKVRAVQAYDLEGLQQIVEVRTELAEGYWTTPDGESVTSADADFVDTRSRAVATFEVGENSPTGHSYQVTTTLRTPDGEIVDTRSERMEIGGEGLDDGILKSRIRARKKGGHRTVAITGSDEPTPVRAIGTVIRSAEGEVLHESFDDAPVSIARDFAFDGLTFSDTPVGSPYNLTISLRDREGSILETMDVLIENLEDESQNTIVVAPPDDSRFDAAAVTLSRIDDTTWDIGFGVSGELANNVSDIEVLFEEPFDGPVPDDTVLTLDFNASYQKWADTFDSSIDLSDDDLTIEQTLYTDDGKIIEEVQWTGPVGATYKNGKGTRTATSSSSPTLSLL